MKCVRLFLNNGFVTDERSSTTWQEYEIYDLDKKLKTTSIISLTKIFLVIFFFFFLLSSYTTLELLARTGVQYQGFYMVFR